MIDQAGGHPLESIWALPVGHEASQGDPMTSVPFFANLLWMRCTTMPHYPRHPALTASDV
jgi:hypothetical protein